MTWDSDKALERIAAALERLLRVAADLRDRIWPPSRP
jgi:hypothetical protein